MGLEHDKIWAVWEAAARAATLQGKSVTGRLVQRTLHTVVGRETGPSVHLQSSSNNWYTPIDLIQLVKEVFTEGIIDLDPCSSSEAQKIVQAVTYWTETDQSLSNTWRGRVFVNPPFGCKEGQSVQAFFNKAVREHAQRHLTEVLLLLKAAVGYKWFASVYDYPHVFLAKRVAFCKQGSGSEQQGLVEQRPCNANPHGSVAVYIGPNASVKCSRG